MADVKISDLTDGTAVVTGDLVEIERPGSPNVSRRVPLGTAAGADEGNFAAASHTHTASEITDFNTAADGRVSAAIGSTVQAYSAQLASMASLASNGLAVRTAANTITARSIAAGTGISVTNGDGVSGNPTVAADIGTSAGTVAAGDDSRITGAVQTGSRAAVSVIGRSANSIGDAADIAAGSNDTILRRVSNALGFGQLTIGMIPNTLITFAKMATGAVATFTEFNTATASKLLSTASVWASPVALSDATTISINLNNGYDFTVTLAGNRTLGAPSNVRHGKKGIIWVSASGSTRTLTLNSSWVMEADAETGPYSITTSERLGVCYACDNTTARVTGILRF